jgi:hypothetical protein
MDTAEVGKIVGGLLAGGGVTAIGQAVTQLLILINHLTADDPTKEAKARRAVFKSLMGIIKEIRGANQQDVTALVEHFSNIMGSE